MFNQHLEDVLCDLIEAIRGLRLGDATNLTINDAGNAIICLWNGEHPTDTISVSDELNNWKDSSQLQFRNLCKSSPGCHICGGPDH